MDQTAFIPNIQLPGHRSPAAAVWTCVRVCSSGAQYDLTVSSSSVWVLVSRWCPVTLWSESNGRTKTNKQREGVEGKNYLLLAQSIQSIKLHAHFNSGYSVDMESVLWTRIIK